MSLHPSRRHHQQPFGDFGPSKRTVTFRYKDYAHQSQIRTMTFPLAEFLRRFCLHILPLRFVKIRHYGLLSNRDRSARIAQARVLLARVPSPPRRPRNPS